MVDDLIGKEIQEGDEQLIIRDELDDEPIVLETLNDFDQYIKSQASENLTDSVRNHFQDIYPDMSSDMREHIIALHLETQIIINLPPEKKELYEELALANADEMVEQSRLSRFKEDHPEYDDLDEVAQEKIKEQYDFDDWDAGDLLYQDALESNAELEEVAEGRFIQPSFETQQQLNEISNRTEETFNIFDAVRGWCSELVDKAMSYFDPKNQTSETTPLTIENELSVNAEDENGHVEPFKHDNVMECDVNENVEMSVQHSERTIQKN